ncbi:microsomal epoxide hydrolase [Xylariaceae sp. FL0016]|nr:microsomal epoxide hydrolase [Xylariaceae sp. FL0016]
MSEEIQPFQIAIPDVALADLQTRLRNTRFPDELSAGGWDLGSPLEDVKRLASHWAERFDWRAAEAALNKLPQFTTRLGADGFAPFSVHFVHARSTRADAIPLLFVHGWPGSFYEGTKLIEPLTQPGEGQPAFHVVVPSIPNFGFSEGPKERGFSVDQHGDVLHQLMLRLGYDQYVTQGGDWGWMITRAMSRKYAPRHIKAQHLNLEVFSTPSLFRNPILAIQSYLSLAFPSERQKQGFERFKWFQAEGSGYSAIQGTKPQTAGYALTDSPVACLAWIYEKLHDWTDDYPWTDDEVCTWISIYWFSTMGPHASQRLYYEFARKAKSTAEQKKMEPPGSTIEELQKWQDVKIGLAHFPGDVIAIPGTTGKLLGRVVYEKDHKDGGHFAA